MSLKFPGIVPIYSLGASLGIAAYPEPGRTAADVLRHADEAMYLDKEPPKKARHSVRS